MISHGKICGRYAQARKSMSILMRRETRNRTMNDLFASLLSKSNRKRKRRGLQTKPCLSEPSRSPVGNILKHGLKPMFSVEWKAQGLLVFQLFIPLYYPKKSSFKWPSTCSMCRLLRVLSHYPETKSAKFLCGRIPLRVIAVGDRVAAYDVQGPLLLLILAAYSGDHHLNFFHVVV